MTTYSLRLCRRRARHVAGQAVLEDLFRSQGGVAFATVSRTAEEAKESLQDGFLFYSAAGAVVDQYDSDDGDDSNDGLEDDFGQKRAQYNRALGLKLFAVYLAGGIAETCRQTKPWQYNSNTCGDEAYLFDRSHRWGLTDDEESALFKEAGALALDLIRNEAVSAAITELAKMLMDRGRVEGSEVTAIVDRHGRDKMMAAANRHLQGEPAATKTAQA